MPEPSGGADSFPQRTRAWGQRVLFAQRRGGLAYGEIIPQPFFEILSEVDKSYFVLWRAEKKIR